MFDTFSIGDNIFLPVDNIKIQSTCNVSLFMYVPPLIFFVTDFIIPVTYISVTFCLLTNSSSISSTMLLSSSPFAPYHPLHSDSSQCFHLSGEIFELKAELNSDKKDRKKEAVKKVIASMTVGKDVR